jgi:hypothetical protein
MSGEKFPERDPHHVLATGGTNAGDRCVDQLELLLIEHQLNWLFPLRHPVLRRSFADSAPDDCLIERDGYDKRGADHHELRVRRDIEQVEAV